MPRAGNTSPATLHMRAQEHGDLRAKQGIQNVGQTEHSNTTPGTWLVRVV
jgi:hypothetical protein